MLEGVDRELLSKGKLHDRLLLMTAEQPWNRGYEDRHITEVGSNHVAILIARARVVQIGSRDLFSVA